MKPATPWKNPKKSTKISKSSNCHRAIKSFDSSIKNNFRVFQNDRKKEKSFIVLHHFSLHFKLLDNHHYFECLPMKQLTEREITWCQHAAVSFAKYDGFDKFKVMDQHNFFSLFSKDNRFEKSTRISIYLKKLYRSMMF